MTTTEWTLDELNERVREALSVDYVPASSARVRAVPDRRTIRYYTTLGLIDRAERVGRTNYYGPRHLLQIVAIKRLQAQGLSLTQVQARLAGLDDQGLAEVASLPSEAPSPASRRDSFWTEAPADVPPLARSAAIRPTAAEHRPAPAAPDPNHLPFTGVPLASGVSLLLGTQVNLDPEAVRSLRTAAAPLLRALREHGILPEGELL